MLLLQFDFNVNPSHPCAVSPDLLRLREWEHECRRRGCRSSSDVSQRRPVSSSSRKQTHSNTNTQETVWRCSRHIIPHNTHNTGNISAAFFIWFNFFCFDLFNCFIFITSHRKLNTPLFFFRLRGKKLQ